MAMGKIAGVPGSGATVTVAVHYILTSYDYMVNN